MNSFTTLPRCQSQRGFVLVTSLIFLVVITLLAVSAISSSTLQERMASNLREKSRARQAADAALRAAEIDLSSANLASYQKAQNCNEDGEINQPENGIVICRQGVFAAAADDGGESYFDADIWDSAAVQTYTADQEIGTDVRFIVEELDDCVGTVDPEKCSRAYGTFRYRVTALARGENPAAIAVTQSVYERTY